MKKFILLWSFLFFFSITHVSAQTPSISASVDRAEIPLGQSLNLEIKYSNSQPPQADLTELRQDFDVVGVLESTNINITNAQRRMEYVRKFRLIPKYEGEVTIPAFADSQGNKSAPITIKVLPAGTTINTPQPTSQRTNSIQTQEQSFSLQGEINNKNPYVQQEIIYSLKLLDSGGLQGREPLFELSNNNDWIIRSIGTPEIKPLVIDGKKMREITFKYALFPQRSGKLNVPAARFEGYTLVRPQKRIDPFADLFGDDLSATLGFTFAEQNPVILRSKPIEVDVQPIPAANDGNWWLPAKDVMLVDKWEPETNQFKVGEAVHRTIYLKADGVLDNQLPELQFTEINGVKQYPEKPATEMSAENGSVVSVMKISNVYIPSRAGNAIIPEMSVHWFDVETKQLKTARIPAKKIIITGSTADMDVQNLPINPEPIINQQNQITDMPQVQTMALDNSINHMKLLLIAGVAFILGILLTILFMRKKSPSPEHNLKKWKNEVLSCAKNKDFRGLRDSLLNWGAEKFATSKLNNFNELKNLVKDKDFSNELDKLNALLYTENDIEWQAKEFCAIFERIAQKKKNSAKSDKILPDLY